VLVVARTVPAAAALSESLRRRDAQKIYWALTRGVPKKRAGTIKLALTKEGARGEERMVGVERDAEDAKHAITDYVVIDRAGEEYAWVAAKPVTGRTHQIRVHLANLGTPIVGDFKYGGTAARPVGALENRLHLHAHSIDITHPDGGRLSVTAPLPPHMQKAWKLLGFHERDTKNPFPARSKK
jgi:23S rRNA pseudouridine955/2504/2580 synthase